jgi:hypothetical protein
VVPAVEPGLRLPAGAGRTRWRTTRRCAGRSG